MTYLQRRIQFFFEQVQTGSIRFADTFLASDSGKELLRALSQVKTFDDGSVDVTSCSPLVRSVAKAVFNTHAVRDEMLTGKHAETRPEVSVTQVSQAMREYFGLIESFFTEFSGTSADAFDLDRHRRSVLSQSREQSDKAFHIWQKYIPIIGKFYAEKTSLLLGCSRAIGGLKCVLGGSSRFPDAALAGVRKFALYADTIFIPDPILPWIETERQGERFPMVHLLLACRTLLLLKPIVDAQLAYPAIVVFPSWEKRLEEEDAVTQDGISRLICDFFSHYLSATFEDESELVAYVKGRGRDAFATAVSQNRLFWPPEADAPTSFEEGVNAYRDWCRNWRSPEWLEQSSSLAPQLLVLTGITERLNPQFHARDNATTLGAQPLFWLPSQFHYFKLTSQVGNDSLRQTGLLNPSTHSALQALLAPSASWLGNVPIGDIARLREEGCNEEFRCRIRTYLDELDGAALTDIDNVVAGVMRGLHSLLEEHDRKAQRIAEQYVQKHAGTLGLSILTTCALMYPSLDPWLGLAPLAPLGKLAKDLIGEFFQNRTLARSLTGVLCEAKHRKDQG